jgi:hypothetical protein
MNVVSRCLVFLGLLLLILGNPSCKQEEKAKKKDSGNGTGSGSRTERDDDDEGDDDDDDDGDDSGTNTGGANSQANTATATDPCSATGGGATSIATSSATGSTTSTDTATDDGLTLRHTQSSNKRQSGARLQGGDPSYDGGVKAVLQSKCIGCHGAVSLGGDLSTYAKAKEAAALIKSEIEGGSMPPALSQPLTAAEKTMLLGWVDAGAPQTAQAGTDTDTDTDTDSTPDTDAADGDDGVPSAGDPCAPVDGGSSDVPTIDELFAELLGEKERQECAARDLLFDRKTKTCQDGVVLAKSYQCTREGVIGKFNELKTPGSDKIFDQYVADGFTLDQCGERNGRPVINFYKRVDNGGDEAVLQQRYLCASGDPLCTKKN